MELQKCLEGRRSIRKYQDKEISREQLNELFKAALLAPSWKNSEVSRYYVIDTKEKKEEFKKYLPQFNVNNTENCSAYIVSTVVDGKSGYTVEGEYATHLKEGFECFDNGLQVQNLCLKAYEMGFGTLIMGLYDEAGIREYLNVPDGEIIVTVLSVGYPDIEPNMPKRKELDEVVTYIGE